MPDADPQTSEAIARIEAGVVALTAKVDQALNGNPAAGLPGIWIRVDRVEQIVRAAIFLACTALVAAVGAVVSAFTGHK